MIVERYIDRVKEGTNNIETMKVISFFIYLLYFFHSEILPPYHKFN